MYVETGCNGDCGCSECGGQTGLAGLAGTGAAVGTAVGSAYGPVGAAVGGAIGGAFDGGGSSGGSGMGAGAPMGVTNTISNQVSPQISPQISPNFIQQFQPSGSPVNASTSSNPISAPSQSLPSAPQTGFIPGFDTPHPLSPQIPMPPQQTSGNYRMWIYAAIGAVVLAGAVKYARRKPKTTPRRVHKINGFRRGRKNVS